MLWSFTWWLVEEEVSFVLKCFCEIWFLIVNILVVVATHQCALVVAHCSGGKQEYCLATDIWNLKKIILVLFNLSNLKTDICKCYFLVFGPVNFLMWVLGVVRKWVFYGGVLVWCLMTDFFEKFSGGTWSDDPSLLPLCVHILTCFNTGEHWKNVTG